MATPCHTPMIKDTMKVCRCLDGFLKVEGRNPSHSEGVGMSFCRPEVVVYHKSDCRLKKKAAKMVLNLILKYQLSITCNLASNIQIYAKFSIMFHLG
jgi:hypothetical protein